MTVSGRTSGSGESSGLRSVSGELGQAEGAGGCAVEAEVEAEGCAVAHAEEYEDRAVEQAESEAGGLEPFVEQEAETLRGEETVMPRRRPLILAGQVLFPG